MDQWERRYSASARLGRRKELDARRAGFGARRSAVLRSAASSCLERRSATCIFRRKGERQRAVSSSTRRPLRSSRSCFRDARSRALSPGACADAAAADAVPGLRLQVPLSDAGPVLRDPTYPGLHCSWRETSMSRDAHCGADRRAARGSSRSGSGVLGRRAPGSACREGRSSYSICCEGCGSGLTLVASGPPG